MSGHDGLHRIAVRAVRLSDAVHWSAVTDGDCLSGASARGVHCCVELRNQARLGRCGIVKGGDLSIVAAGDCLGQNRSLN